MPRSTSTSATDVAREATRGALLIAIALAFGACAYDLDGFTAAPADADPGSSSTKTAASTSTSSSASSSSSTSTSSHEGQD